MTVGFDRLTVAKLVGVPAQRNQPMAKVTFTANLQRHVACPEVEAPGDTLREVLDAVFAKNERARGYVLDDQAGLRKHMAIFIDGSLIRDRVHLSDPVPADGRVYIMQALSGG